jgi:uncharacterized delta-60 repeat protein
MRTPILTLLCLLLPVLSLSKGLAPCTAQAACDPNIPADLSGDCHVDFNDFAIMASDWLQSSTGEANQEWLARYNGPGNKFDYGNAIALDSKDNIYVTGGSDSSTSVDYATVKYSPDSNQPVWVARYNGPANDDDYAHAIAVDRNDNIYVTGYSTGSGTFDDYATIKYSADSNQPVWIARYDGPPSHYDEAWAIAVDSNDNIYVTGRSMGSATGYYDYTTIKYSPDSNQPVWVARYDGPDSDDDTAWAIAVDSKDNIYVTGASMLEAASYNDDYATIKYSPDSNLPVWVARYNPANDQDAATAIAVDSSDNIYVTGYPLYPATNNDYATIKYSPDSNHPVWVHRYNGPGNSVDAAHCIAIDSNDNIYVTGNSAGSGTFDDYATIKYSVDHTCTPPIIGDFNHNCTVDI